MSKTASFLAVLLLLSLFATPVPAETFGPDSGGYVADTEATFDWIDTSGATDTGVDGDDTYEGSFSIGFDFVFYGETYSDFYANSNGWISFYEESDSYPEPFAFVDGSFDAWISAFAGDRAVESGDGGAVVYKLFGTAPNRYLVIEYQNMRQAYLTDQWFMDAQIILYETTNEIKVQYDNMDIDPWYAIEGIQNEENDSWINPSNRRVTWITSGMAISYTPTGKVGATHVHDELWGIPGEEFTHRFRLENLTGSQETYDLSIAGETWTSTLSDASLTLDSGIADDFYVYVDVPASAGIFDTDSFELTVTPQSAPGDAGTRTVVTVASADARQVDTMPVDQLKDPAMSAYDGKIYTFGGYTWTKDGVIDTIYEYDPVGDSWSVFSEVLPAAFQLGYAEVVGDVACIYDPLTGNLYEYDFVGEAWTTDSTGPVGLEEGDSTSYDGLVYIGDSSGNFHSYDPATNTWSTLASMPDTRKHFRLLALDGTIYGIGGYNSSKGEVFADVMVYDIAGGTWATIQEPPEYGISGHSIFTDGRRIFCAGGENISRQSTGLIHVFDVATEEWSFYPGETIESGYGPRAEVISDQAFIAGGYHSGPMESDVTLALDLCDIPTPDFNADATDVSVGDTVTFTSNDPGAAPCNYYELEYDFGDGETGSEDPAEHAYDAPGVYTVSLTATSTGGTEIETKTDYITVTAADDDDATDDDTTDDDDDTTDDDAADDDDTVPAGGGDDDDDDDDCCCG